MSIDDFRRKAAEFMSAAASAENMKQRSELIDAAVYWHTLALEAEAKPMLTLDFDLDDAPGPSSPFAHV